MRPEPAKLALSGIRRLIDGVDDALLVLLAGRRGCVRVASQIKQHSGLPMRDPAREAQVRERASRLSRRLGLPSDVGERVSSALIADACQQQGLPIHGHEVMAADPDQRGNRNELGMLQSTMKNTSAFSSRSWLRLLPPPRRVAPLLRHVPAQWQARCLDLAISRVLSVPLSEGALEPIRDRRLGIEVSDLGLRWVVALRGDRMQVCDGNEVAEATVRGTATDLLLLASRREDADTLFFQRRLLLTGDTELGLTARNLLDQLPWEGVPLGLRILLHRSAGIAEAARAASRASSATA